jgi:hypothetical protein
VKLPEITEVERLTLKPGDFLIVHVGRRPDPRTAAMVREQVQAAIRRDDVKILVLDPDMTVKVAGKP